MAQLVRFEPDPEGDGDLGVAHFDDGSSLYTSQSMIPPELRGPDLRLAQNMSPLPPPEAVAGSMSSVYDVPGGFSSENGPAAAPPPALMPNMAGTGGAAGAGPAPATAPVSAQTGSSAPGIGPALSGDPEAPVNAQVAQALNNPVVTHTAPGQAPAALQPQLQNLGYLGGPGSGQAQVDLQGQQAQNPMLDIAQAYAPRGHGATRGGMIPSTEKVTSEAGVPYSTAEAQVRELANQKVVEAQIATAESQAARAQAQKLATEAALPALQLKQQEAQAHYDTINANYQRERAQLQFEIDDFDRTAKVDPDRWFAERGAWGTIGAVIGQALGAYAATLGHTPNWAQQSIDTSINRDIAAQEATLNQKRLGQRNALARLADRYGDVDQARSALKLAQQQIADKQILAFGLASQRDDIINAAQEWVAKNQQQRVNDELALYHASVGKQTTEANSRYLMPSAGGPPSAKALGDYFDALNKGQKFYKGLEDGQGGPPRIKPMNPANPLYVEPLGWSEGDKGGYARQMDEAKGIRQKQAEFKAAMDTLTRAEQLLSEKSRLVGAGRTGTEAYNQAQTLQSMMETTVAKAYGGVITDSDRQAAVKELPDITSSNITGGELARLHEARGKLMRTYENLSTSTLTPYEPAPPLRATSREHQDD